MDLKTHLDKLSHKLSAAEAQCDKHTKIMGYALVELRT